MNQVAQKDIDALVARAEQLGFPPVTLTNYAGVPFIFEGRRGWGWLRRELSSRGAFEWIERQIGSSRPNLLPAGRW